MVFSFSAAAFKAQNLCIIAMNLNHGMNIFCDLNPVISQVVQPVYIGSKEITSKQVKVQVLNPDS